MCQHNGDFHAVPRSWHTLGQQLCLLVRAEERAEAVPATVELLTPACWEAALLCFM